MEPREADEPRAGAPRRAEADTTAQRRTPGTRPGAPLRRLVVDRPVPAGPRDGDDRAADAPAISSDGRYVAYVALAADGRGEVHVRDTVDDVTVLASRSSRGGPSSGSCSQPAISADGRFVAFTSDAEDLVTTPVGAGLQVYLHDLRSGRTALVSRADDGRPGERDSFSPSVSADGRFVAFTSLARTLDDADDNDSPDVYLHDRITGHTELVSVEEDGTSAGGVVGRPSVSAGGRLVAFATIAAVDPEDTNETSDVYVHDTRTGETDLVSRAEDGEAADAPSHHPAISADGSTVAFASAAGDIVPGDDDGHEDVFVHHREEGTTELVSQTPQGEPGNDDAHSPSLSGDGSRVAFLSEATDLVPAMEGAAPGVDRAYVRDLDGAGTALAGHAPGRAPGDGEARAVSLSSWGRHVAFSDTSTDLSAPPGEGGAPRRPGVPQVYRTTLRTAQIPAPQSQDYPRDARRDQA